jgi:hypothetical protein
MVFGVKQLQREDWIKQPKRKWCTRARQPMKELCTKVKQLQLGVRYVSLYNHKFSKTRDFNNHLLNAMVKDGED